MLDGLERIDICTAYRCGGRTLTEFPSDIGQLAACEPVYESMPGWSAPTAGVRRFDELPEAARRYIARLEEVSGVPRGDRLDRLGARRHDRQGRRAEGAAVLQCYDAYVLLAEARPTARGVRVDELDARAVARAAVGRDLERRPRHGGVEPDAAVVVVERHAHALVRLEDRRRHHLRADGRQVDERRRVAVDAAPRPCP